MIEGMQAEGVKISHLLSAEYIFRSDHGTAEGGAVMFPSSRVAGSTQCGLSKATITVEDVHGDAEPLTCTTDEAGWFDIRTHHWKDVPNLRVFCKPRNMLQWRHDCVSYRHVEMLWWRIVHDDSQRPVKLPMLSLASIMASR